jgi:hypothetical protein
VGGKLTISRYPRGKRNIYLFVRKRTRDKRRSYILRYHSTAPSGQELRRRMKLFRVIVSFKTSKGPFGGLDYVSICSILGVEQWSNLICSKLDSRLGHNLQHV